MKLKIDSVYFLYASFIFMVYCLVSLFWFYPLDSSPLLFSLVELRKHKSLKDIIGQLRNRFVNLFNTEYEWELKKKLVLR